MKAIIYILNTILVIVLGGVIAFLLLPRFGLTVPFELKIVRSGSMAPDIPTGSLVFIQKDASYKVGDVITFGADTPASVPTSHRIVSLRTENGTTYFTTKGDANDSIDANETVASEVIGKIVFSIPSAGYILAFSKTRLGFALMVLTPAALVILFELIGIVREVRVLVKRKREGEQLAALSEEKPEPSAQAFRASARKVNMQMLHFDIGTPCVWRGNTVV